MSRRRILTAVGAVATGAAIGVTHPFASALAAPQTSTWSGRYTQNGWPVVDRSKVASLRVEGSDATLDALPGAVATVLSHVVRRFHYEIATVGRNDVHGYVTDRSVTAAFESNYLSATAVAIHAGRFPAGSSGNLFSPELAILRDILAECGGVVRWGGDDRSCPKEGHFQIDVSPGDPRLKRAAAKIQAWRDHPGQGAGTPVDVFAAERRSAAKSLEKRQRG